MLGTAHQSSLLFGMVRAMSGIQTLRSVKLRKLITTRHMQIVQSLRRPGASHHGTAFRSRPRCAIDICGSHPTRRKRHHWRTAPTRCRGNSCEDSASLRCLCRSALRCHLETVGTQLASCLLFCTGLAVFRLPSSRMCASAKAIERDQRLLCRCW